MCAALAALGAMACGGNKGAQTDAVSDTVSRRYVGTLPAADGPGIVYDLTLVNPAEDSLAGEIGRAHD